ncbi:MAG: response regulator [Lachnospiraceae bacterium]|nr:response regulator [Lachnospiraceae bacterium]
MKYNVLLFGMNTTVIEDFFNMGNDVFEFISSSLNYTDIMNHIKFYDLNILIYCLNQETKENMSKMVTIKRQAEKKNIPFIIVGNQEDCTTFEKTVYNIADLTILKPSTASMIQEQIVKFMKQREDLARQEEEAEIAAQAEVVEQKLAEELQKEEAAKAEAQTTAQPDTPQEEAEEDSPSVRKHILVIDDDPHMLKVLKHHLSNKYDVATAVSGAIALRFLQKKKTNLILLDYAMPQMDGPAVLEQLHANPETKDIPVLFLTGASEKDKIQKALSLNPQGYLLKPVDQATLLDRIKEQIG